MYLCWTYKNHFSRFSVVKCRAAFICFCSVLSLNLYANDFYMNTQEIWKPVPGYEDAYEVSSFGRVRSIARTIYCRNRWGGTISKSFPSRIKAQTNNRNLGYFSISIDRGKGSKTLFVHRLVAKAFIPNPDNLPYVNHKDRNPSNNRVENLEWCTPYYNNHYDGACERSRRHEAVRQYDLNGKFIKEYPSQKVAAERTGAHSDAICACCHHRCLSSGGFQWRLAKDNILELPRLVQRKKNQYINRLRE